MADAPIIVWFRQDLRLSDNPALHAAGQTGRPVLPIYILDDDNAGTWKIGAAGRWWLHYSLHALKESLSGHLACYDGDPLKILSRLIKETKAAGLFWNRCYEPWRMDRDKALKQALGHEDFEIQSFNSALIHEPWTVQKDDGTPYRVFTPFFRNGMMRLGDPPVPLPSPKNLKLIHPPERTLEIEDLALLPRDVRWDKKMEPYWRIGEDGAKKQLKKFIMRGLKGYKEGRDYPTRDHVSRLSPHFHYGEISPRAVWHAVRKTAAGADSDCYLSELGWREFSHSLLFYNQHLPEKPLQKKFMHMPWVKNPKHLRAWQKGLTGYPIVDAGMRELWETGWMHNRVRMITASFLIKDLGINWTEGEKWFWECLVDADLANNAASWQWVAGCGADAAPYFRVFNPVTQGEKFDKTGEYIRKFVPEIAKLPDRYIHAPWTAPKDTLNEAGIVIGKTYPKPIVDHGEARVRALETFKAIG